MFDNRPRQTANPAEVIDQIKDLVAPYYNALDDWHNLDHGNRVVAMAMEVNKSERGDPFLVEAGAWLHQYHQPNLELLEPVLKKLSLPEQTTQDLRDIVTLCRPNLIETRPAGVSDAAWKAAQIVFDGDALDLMGPSGIFREVCCNLVFRDKPQGEAIEQARNVHKMFADKLQTETAKKLAAPGIAAIETFFAVFDTYESGIKSRGAGSY